MYAQYHTTARLYIYEIFNVVVGFVSIYMLDNWKGKEKFRASLFLIKSTCKHEPLPLCYSNLAFHRPSANIQFAQITPLTPPA